MNARQRERKRKAEWKGALRASEPTMMQLPPMDMASEQVQNLLADLYIKGIRKGERTGRMEHRKHNSWFHRV